VASDHGLGRPADSRRAFRQGHVRRVSSKKPEGRTGDSFLIQHLREVAIDHQNGVFAGKNDVGQEIGGRQPTTLEEFITKHRQAFA